MRVAVPGVIDAWSMLLFNWLRHAKGTASLPPPMLSPHQANLHVLGGATEVVGGATTGDANASKLGGGAWYPLASSTTAVGGRLLSALKAGAGLHGGKAKFIASREISGEIEQIANASVAPTLSHGVHGGKGGGGGKGKLKKLKLAADATGGDGGVVASDLPPGPRTVRKLAALTNRTMRAETRTSRTSASRFWSFSLEVWLGTRAASASLEKCTAGERCTGARMRLSRQWWWAFVRSGPVASLAPQPPHTHYPRVHVTLACPQNCTG